MNDNHRLLRATVAALGLALLLVGVSALRADDRDFVRKSSENPYVMVILDLSGSMNWTPPCTQTDFNAGKCRQVCPTGDCFTPLNADGPASKFYQAKEALYEVVSNAANVQFGFATYNQDQLHAASKHWIYTAPVATSSLIALQDSTFFPRAGGWETFGKLWTCTSGSAIGCDAANPADLTDSWETNRVRRLPKLGVNNPPNQSQTFFVRSGGTIYRVIYQTPITGTLGASTVTVNVSVNRCTNGSCSTSVAQTGSPKNITFNLVDQFLAWEYLQVLGTVEQETHFGDVGDDQVNQATTCDGWDPNSDDLSDPFSAYNLRFKTVTDPRGASYDTGDLLPLDWLNNHRNDILDRLAPDQAGGFDQASYFQDYPQAGGFLKLADPACNTTPPGANCKRPLITSGLTPLGASMSDFSTWYNTWSSYASTHDLPQWGCRKKYLIVLTDGDETCGGLATACSTSKSLFDSKGIRTYVVGFGLPSVTSTSNCTQASPPNGSDALQCMAACGGTGQPFYPQNKDELVAQLNAILDQIKQEERAFASAAVPSVEANVKDKIFLSDLIPVNGKSIWLGRLDAYLKPLPLKADGVTPDNTKACGSATSNCHAWNAGDELWQQAPDPLSSNLKIGTTIDERRILYPAASGALWPLRPPQSPQPDPGGWYDLFGGLGFKDAGVAGSFAANQTRATNIIRQVLNRKTTTLPPPDDKYVLGDIFHSDPIVIESPGDFDDFANDRFYGSTGVAATGDGTRPCDLSTNFNRGYKCFAFKYQFRRKLVAVGTNDAQLHAFDAGTVEGTTNPKFNNGDGREAFAFMPRMVLPILREQAEGTNHIFGVDGQHATGDVFLTSDQQWHTIVVGGLREGGRIIGGEIVNQPEEGGTGSEDMHGGYYALDITQPDPLQLVGGRFLPTITSGFNPVPGCAKVEGDLSVPVGSCPRPYPQLLWEFTDRNPTAPPVTQPPTVPAPMDEDCAAYPCANGADLGAPWSKPVITRVKLAGGVTRFVVVVGGGVPPDTASNPTNKTAVNPTVGNWIYILDARTGQPIYKREVQGSVPSVSVLDNNNDNVADAIYFGTTAGRVYKIDLSTAAALTPIVVKDRTGAQVTVQRVAAGTWDPFIVFTTGNNSPVFMQMQVLFVQRLGRFALVFGTGDREDLWSSTIDPAGRLYVIVDDGWTAATGLTEANFKQITPNAANLAANTNLLLAPGGSFSKGWYMLLDPDERVITKAFGVGGILTFSSFQPVITPPTGPDQLCARAGASRNFVVSTTNANAIANLDTTDPGVSSNCTGCSACSSCERQKTLADFVTSPFIEQTQSQNNPTTEPVSCTDDARLAAIINVLKANGPTNARYGNYFLRIGQRESKRGIFYPACVPIAIMETNWKEN